MGKKFCPQCNMNVSVVRRGGKKCCPCCGFNADYMGPAVSEQYSSSRPPTQNQTMVKPDVHDDGDRTFSQYTAYKPAGSNISKSARGFRIVNIILIAISLIMSMMAVYICDVTWTFSDGTTKTCTIMQVFSDNGYGDIIILLTAITFIVAFACPRYLGIIYFLIGIVGSSGAESFSADQLYGEGAFLVSLVIGFFIYMWEREIGMGRLKTSKFVKAFWFNSI